MLYHEPVSGLSLICFKENLLLLLIPNCANQHFSSLSQAIINTISVLGETLLYDQQIVLVGLAEGS